MLEMVVRDRGIWKETTPTFENVVLVQLQAISCDVVLCEITAVPGYGKNGTSTASFGRFH